MARKKRSGSRASAQVSTTRSTAVAPSPGAPRLGADRVMLVIALSGIALTAVLLWGAGADGGLPYCADGSGCDIVQASPWSRFLGLPLALWGMFSYLILALAAVTGTRARRRRTLALLATAGFVISIYLTAVSVLVIGATCPYCLASAALFTAAFAASLTGQFDRVHPGTLASHGHGATLAVVVALAMHLQAGGFAGRTAADPYLSGLATQLKAAGATFYGAYWCPHCQQQKALFGAAAAALPYVECSPNGPKAPRATTCEMAGIRNYPTWVIAGRQIVRVMQPKELAVLVGFALPPDMAGEKP